MPPVGNIKVKCTEIEVTYPDSIRAIAISYDF